MKKILTFHSYRRGVGKTHIAACVASLLALDGYHVGIMDTSFLSPSIHILFQLNEDRLKYKINDYILKNCSIRDTIYDISDRLPFNSMNKGKLYLAPGSSEPNDILQVLRQGSNLEMLSSAQQEMIKAFNLDVLVIDTYSGLNENALHSTALSSALTLIMRPDRQDYDGTGILIDIAKKLYVPNISLVMNEVPYDYALSEVGNEIETKYDCKVGAVIPHIEELLSLASNDVFVLRYPEHPAVTLFKNLANSLINNNIQVKPKPIRL